MTDAGAQDSLRVAILCASDKGYRRLREDTATPAIASLMREDGYAVVSTILLPDDRTMIAEELTRLCDEQLADLILTTGGTGLSPRDVTPEATLDVVQRLVPGIPETMRAAGMLLTDRAMLSRATAGIRGTTLIINLPGSPKGAVENLTAVLPALRHGLETLTGRISECARHDHTNQTKREVQ
ncbi:MAG: MogA/MoaB family molybdenum cofactor biosynthesis protein [Sphaerochaetaceae bacterium]|jgi:molybdopterin adenylyltransferase